MPNLKSKIARYMCIISLIMVLFMTVCSLFIQLRSEQRHTRAAAEETFRQVEHILTKNRQELSEIKAEYGATCLRYAENIAYYLQNNPDKIENYGEMARLARLVGVDEIHIFNSQGVLYAGTRTDYYGLTMESGEQLAFFKPLLKDKSRRLVQEITPNTADGSAMQYSALWSKNGEFIVQVGMTPSSVMKVTRRNELSYIFSLLQADSGVELFAADKETLQILGSTDEESLGKALEEIGISPERAANGLAGFHAKVNGVGSYCISSEIDGNYICYVKTNEGLYKSVPGNMLIQLISLALIAVLLVAAVTRYMEVNVIRNISRTNAILRQIAEGDLEKSVGITQTIEFSELSSHINEMIRSLLAGTEKMSYVLNHSDINIGVYEYSPLMRKVRCTDRVPDLLMIDGAKSERLTPEREVFEKHISELKQNPVPDEEGVFSVAKGDSQKYVRVEEIEKSNGITGIIVDVTDQIEMRRRIEAERDVDQLTGILNRRGLDNSLLKLFRSGENIGHSALVMVDADGLKLINDKYGHDNGDIYIKTLADTLDTFGRDHCRKYFVSRNGGDEFVMFLYGYGSEDELLQSLEILSGLQDSRNIALNNGLTVTVRFSAGWCVRTEDTPYDTLFKTADDRMYENKRGRKKAAAEKAAAEKAAAEKAAADMSKDDTSKDDTSKDVTNE